MQVEQRITPFLSYVNDAELAARFYVSVIPESKIRQMVKNPADGSVITVDFELAGMSFVALNTGQDWKFTEAMSLAISCDTQYEIDSLWERLIADGGQEVACGWLKDKFGMSWQVVPTQIQQWVSCDDGEAVGRMFAALRQMKKLNIAALQTAFEGPT